MIKSNGIDKARVAVFISGKGSNLKSLIKFSFKKNSKFKISLIVSNNSKALGLKYAKLFKVKKKIINYKNKRLTENDLIKKLKKERINIICLAGFMKIISKNFIKRFGGKILNIHPSLLPKYPGLNTHKKVLENKDSEHGVTVHLVNEGLDSGPIIGFIKLKIYDTESEKDLESRIHNLEHYIYPKILSELQEGKIVIKDGEIFREEILHKNGKEYFI